MAWTPLARAQTPDGAELVLYRDGGGYMIRADGLELVSSRAHRSEEMLAELSLGELSLGELAKNRPKGPRVLLGGLGLGYSLRAVLDRLDGRGSVVVAEIVSEVVDWNRDLVGHLADHPGRDRRATVRACDVAALMAEAEASWDAILLDTDNGSRALTRPANRWLYEPKGIMRAFRALAIGGILSIWSPYREDDLAEDLSRAGFEVKAVNVPADGSNRVAHTIYLGKKIPI